MTTTKYRAWVHPEHVRSNMTRHLCSWCKGKMETTGKVEEQTFSVTVKGKQKFIDVEMVEMACPLAAKHVEDQERWAAMSGGAQAE